MAKVVGSSPIIHSSWKAPRMRGLLRSVGVGRLRGHGEGRGVEPHHPLSEGPRESGALLRSVGVGRLESGALLRPGARAPGALELLDRHLGGLGTTVGA